jgi:hypothetical protein
MPTITDTQSYSWVLHNIVFAAVSQVSLFTTFTKRQTKQLPVQPVSLPYLGCYFIGDDLTPDGDPNVGDVRFINILKLGFSVIVQNNDPDATQQVLDAAYWEISKRLWPDQYIMNMLDTFPYGHPGINNNPDNVRIEGVTRANRKHVWGSAAFNNEIPIGELQFEASLRYRMMWPPYITDDFLLMHQETVPLRNDNTVPPEEEVLRIITEYNFPPAAAASLSPTKENIDG